MTQLLEKAITEVYKLSPEKQDEIASIILEELEDEKRWEKLSLTLKTDWESLPKRFS